MNLAQIWFRHAVLLSVLLTLTACGGGGKATVAVSQRQ